MARKVRLGLIGCGGYMRRHVEDLGSLKSAAIAALADPNATSVKRLVAQYPGLGGLPTFGDYRDMLAEGDLDGVVIASPHTLHYEQIMAALDRGLHVLTEKPMVCSVQHAKDVMRKAKRKGRVVMIGYQRHFLPAFRLARRLIASGEIGRVTFVACLQAQDWLRGTQGTWRQDPAFSGGGQLNDSGSHLVDVILWVGDLAPESVFAEMDRRGSRVDILSGLTVRFKGGAIGSIAVVGDAPTWWEEITFYGEEAALYVRDNRLILQTRGPRGASKDITDRLRYQNTPARNFVRAMLGREEPETPPVWGLRVAQLTEAAWESAHTGKPVNVKR